MRHLQNLSVFVLSLATLPHMQLRAQSGPDILWSTNAHYDVLVAVRFSGDSLRLASAGSQDGNAKVWAVNGGALQRTVHLPSQERVLCVALSKDGSLLGIGGDDDGVFVYRVGDGSRVWSAGSDNNQVNALEFSHDGSNVVWARGGDWSGGQLFVHDTINPTGFGLPCGDRAVYAATFSPDDAFVASGGFDQTAMLWRLSDGALLRTFEGHNGPVHSVEFSPDGSLLATASEDGTARIWNITNGLALVLDTGIDPGCCGHSGGGIARFSADGRLLYTLGSGTFKIWRVATGAHLGGITNTGALITFDVAKNGKYLAYGRYADGVIGAVVVLARMPVVIDEVDRTGDQVTLHWQGGSGLYQVQSSTNLLSASWENSGAPTTNTSVTNFSSETKFFRVQNLPNP